MNGKNAPVLYTLLLALALAGAFAFLCSVKAAAAGDAQLHKAYYFPEADGCYGTEKPFSRRQAARMMEALLEPAEAEDGLFSDLTAEDAAYPGALRMRALGMVEGDDFRPDQPVARGELLAWLRLCFPAAAGEAAPEGIADEVLTGRDVLFLMNRVLGRETAADAIPAEVREAYLDYADDPALLAALAEAGVPHSCDSRSPEVWEDYTILRRPAEGPLWRGNVLYWIGADGRFARGREEKGLLFDKAGRYTSGSTELDALVQQVLDGILTDDMTQYEKLRAVYDYTLKELHYGGGAVYERETDDWWQEEGLRMLTSGHGNCYGFAAAFCALSRPLGYNTKVTSGSSFGQGIHGWAYIMFDGEEHIFDPQSEKVYHFAEMFDLSPAEWEWIQYEPVYSGDGAPESGA